MESLSLEQIVWIVSPIGTAIAAIWALYVKVIVPANLENKRKRLEFQQTTDSKILDKLLDLADRLINDALKEKNEKLTTIGKDIQDIHEREIQVDEALETLVQRIDSLNIDQLHERVRYTDHRWRSFESIQRMLVSLVTSIYNNLFKEQPDFIDEDLT